MERNTKKAECIIHFSNYLMEQDDTTRTITLFSVSLPAGFQLREAELPSLPHHQQHITKPRRFWCRDTTRWAIGGPCDTEHMEWGAQAVCQERLSFTCCDASEPGRTGVCRCPRGRWSLHEQLWQTAYFRGTEATAKLLSHDSVAEDVSVKVTQAWLGK